MAWETPKTDWHGSTDANGNYTGDRFNAVDFNRIKNNLECLRELAFRLYKEFQWGELGEDRTPMDYFYADEINQIESNLKNLNANTLKRSYGNTPTYVDNGNTMNFAELNRVEMATADLYARLTHQAANRRMLVMNFGIKGGL